MLSLIDQAADKGAQVRLLAGAFLRTLLLCRTGSKWYELTERVPDGPTIKLMHGVGQPNTNGDGGPNVRRRPDRASTTTRPQSLMRMASTWASSEKSTSLTAPRDFGRSSISAPAILAIRSLKRGSGQIGVYICYDRHFPDGARCLGLNGAEIVFNPSATVAGLSEYLWKLEQPAHAVANQYFVGAINRPGFEEPWRIGEFYGQSYFCDPRGQIIAERVTRYR